MFFIAREVIGWVLVAIAVMLIPKVFNHLANPTPQVIEAAVVAFVCSLLMRSGIHLVRVSTAARLSMAPRSRSTDLSH